MLMSSHPILLKEKIALFANHEIVTNGFMIRIRPSHKDDKGLLAHEKVHVKQWWLTLGIHSILYIFSKRYRLWSEVKADKEQLKHYPDDRSELFAHFIATKYSLDIDKQDALNLLRQ